MAKVIIWDSNKERLKKYKVKFANIDECKLKVSKSAEDLENCKLFFRHTSDDINEIDSDPRYLGSIKIEFSGDGLNTKVTKEDFPYEATIESPSDLFRVLDILDKDSFTLNDVYYILGYDQEISKLLDKFATSSPIKATKNQKKLKSAKIELQSHAKKRTKE